MNLVNISRFLTKVLRHEPEIIGITLDEHGWADVSELLEKMPGRYQVTMEILEEVVRKNDKQRYSFNGDKTRIRANQGHSIPVDVELEKAEPPEFLWHGTGEKHVNSIDKQGLLRMKRLHVHLSKDVETAKKVGRRHGKPYLYRVLSGEMARDGYDFYLSVNGVWLTKKVPVRYLEKWDVEKRACK